MPNAITSLIDALAARLLAGEKLDNRALEAVALSVTGASLVGGRDPRLAYECAEAAVNRIIQGRFGGRFGAELLAAPDGPAAVAERLDPLLDRLPRQRVRTAEQIELQQFSTPPTLAYVCARALGLTAADEVLEPSAGTGALACWATAAGARVHVNEISERRREILTALGYRPTGSPAEHLNNVLPAEIKPNKILMNPPFSASGGRLKRHTNEIGERHILSALERLQPGGRLVTVTGGGLALGRPKSGPFWKRIEARYTPTASVSVDGQVYAKYGTNFDVHIAVIDKPPAGLAPAHGLSGCRTGFARNAAEACAMLDA